MPLITLKVKRDSLAAEACIAHKKQKRRRFKRLLSPTQLLRHLEVLHGVAPAYIQKMPLLNTPQFDEWLSDLRKNKKLIDARRLHRKMARAKAESPETIRILHEHRVRNLRPEIRAATLAIAYVQGKPYREVEHENTRIHFTAKQKRERLVFSTGSVEWLALRIRTLIEWHNLRPMTEPGDKERTYGDIFAWLTITPQKQIPSHTPPSEAYSRQLKAGREKIIARSNPELLPLRPGAPEQITLLSDATPSREVA
jgi:hypothetical protein